MLSAEEAAEARKAKADVLEAKLEEVQDERSRALDANAKLQRMMQESNQALQTVVLERDDLRERLAKAGAKLAKAGGEVVHAQVEAEATTKKTARKVVEEVVDEALAAASVAEAWFRGMTPDAFDQLMAEMRERMVARIQAIDDFSAEEPF